ncbi:unnamed protein product [Heterobilharzia americana]|nr:unnamed protein product [Heterobilharzia americana]
MAFWTQMFCYLFSVICSYVRILFKYIARKITGKCEISRIIANYTKGAPRTLGIENSLRKSKSNSIRKGLFLDKSTDVGPYVKLVIKLKCISLKGQPKYGYILKFITVFPLTIYTASIRSIPTVN